MKNKIFFLFLTCKLCIANCAFANSAFPVSNFTASNTSLCTGQCISFTDLSTNSPTSWLWNFSGSSSFTSTQQNPSGICYTSPGTYFVSLTVTNSSGSNTLYIQGYITVYPSSVVNLLVNGDFNNYNTGFTTQLTYIPSGAMSPDQYSIDTNAYYHNGNWAGISPDTTPFFMCDGSQTTGRIVWSENVTSVFPNSDYTFSFLMTNLDVNHSFVMPELLTTVTDQFSNVLFTGTTGLLPAANSNVPPVYVWTPFNFIFSTLANTDSIMITISQVGGTYLGFDFALEDVQLKTHFCDSVAAMPDAVLFTDENNICEGACIDFRNFSTNATSYQWYFPGGTPSSSTDANPSLICYMTAGQYDVELIAINGGNSDTMIISNYVTVHSTPISPPITQSGDTLFAPQGFPTYQWYYGSNAIAGATNYFYMAMQSGNYNLVVTDKNGCSVGAGIVNVIASLTPALSEGEEVSVFPNPCTGKFDLKYYSAKNTRATFELINSFGQIIFRQEKSIRQGANSISFREGRGEVGIYLLKITSEEKTVIKKIAIEK